MTSQARIDANRLNAQKSTGPRTAEGKARSRQNGLTHGLTATVCTSPEDQARIDARLADWSEALRPRDSVEAYLVGRAVAASVRLDRCGEVAAGPAAGAVDEDDDAHRLRAARLGEKLKRSPALVVARLRQSVAGLDWLIARWGDLAAAAEAHGHLGLGLSEQAARLLGSAGGEIAPPAAVHRLRELYRALDPPWSPTNQYQRPTPAQWAAHAPARAEHLPRLRALIDEQVAELEQERQRRLDRPAPALSAEAPLAPDRLHRYESSAEMGLHRALNQLGRLQRRPDAELGPIPLGSGPDPRDEANPTPADPPQPQPLDPEPTDGANPTPADPTEPTPAEASPTPAGPPATATADEPNPTPDAPEAEADDEANPTRPPHATAAPEPPMSDGPVVPVAAPSAASPGGANPTGPVAAG